MVNNKKKTSRKGKSINKNSKNSRMSHNNEESLKKSMNDNDKLVEGMAVDEEAEYPQISIADDREDNYDELERKNTKELREAINFGTPGMTKFGCSRCLEELKECSLCPFCFYCGDLDCRRQNGGRLRYKCGLESCTREGMGCAEVIKTRKTSNNSRNNESNIVEIEKKGSNVSAGEIERSISEIVDEASRRVKESEKDNINDDQVETEVRDVLDELFDIPTSGKSENLPHVIATRSPFLESTKPFFVSQTGKGSSVGTITSVGTILPEKQLLQSLPKLERSKVLKAKRIAKIQNDMGLDEVRKQGRAAVRQRTRKIKEGIIEQVSYLSILEDESKGVWDESLAKKIRRKAILEEGPVIEKKADEGAGRETD